MGLFSGLTGLWSNLPQTAPATPFVPYNLQGVGHVVDVILDTSHPQYDPEKNRVVGTVFWRDALSTYTAGQTAFNEAGGGKHANPLDRSNMKLPLPGEQVIVYRAKASRLDGPDVFVSSQYYYGAVVGMTPNTTINSSPFIGIDPDLLNPFLPGQFTVNQLAKRFDKKIKNLASFKEGKKPIVHKQLQLNEGDFILQGRFGGSIRFAGTPISSQQRGQGWAAGDKGLPGDPIMLMRVNGARGSFDDLENTLYEVEDLANDPASIYLTTTQQIQVELALPEKGSKAHPLATWAYDIGITGFESDASKKASGAKDGESARTGDNQTAPKQGDKGSQVKDLTTAPASTDNSQIPDDDQDSIEQAQGYNPVTGQSGFNQTAEGGGN